jgi:hypothetical protein
MTPSDLLVIGIRTASAILWTAVCVSVLYYRRPLPSLGRSMVCLVIVFGMWSFVIGALAVARIIEPSIASLIYTVFAASSGLVAFAILSTGAQKGNRDD